MKFFLLCFKISHIMFALYRVTQKSLEIWNVGQNSLINLLRKFQLLGLWRIIIVVKVATVRIHCCLQIFKIEATKNKHIGPTSAKLLNIYRTLIGTKIDDGAMIYAATSDRFLRPLAAVQNACLRLALCAFPTSAVSSLQSLLATLPLAYHRKYPAFSHSISSLFKIPSFPHSSHCREILFYILHIVPGQSIYPCPHHILPHLPSTIHPWQLHQLNIL